MADISKITTINGTTYNIKDAVARIEMTKAEAEAGILTDKRMISPAVLKTAILAHSYWQYNSATDSIDLIFPS